MTDQTEQDPMRIGGGHARREERQGDRVIQVEDKIYEAMRDAIAKSQKALNAFFDDDIPTPLCADAANVAIHAITWLQEMQGASMPPAVKEKP